MPKNVVIATVVIAVLVLAGWYFMSSKKYSTPQVPAEVSQTPAPAAVESPTSSATNGAVVKEDRNAVQISSSGFLPKSITIKAGETVTWMNSDSINHTVNSAVHPTHLVYPALNLGTIKPGAQVSLEFPKAGTYQYHDHLNPSLTGAVIVE